MARFRGIPSNENRSGFALQSGWPESLEPIVDRLDRVTNRLVLGVLTAAFTVGMGVLMLFYHPAG